MTYAILFARRHTPSLVVAPLAVLSSVGCAAQLESLYRLSLNDFHCGRWLRFAGTSVPIEEECADVVSEESAAKDRLH